MAYKQSPRSPLAKALKGNQHKLPQHLQDAIKAAPESPAKQTKSMQKIKRTPETPGEKKAANRAAQTRIASDSTYTYNTLRNDPNSWMSKPGKGASDAAAEKAGRIARKNEEKRSPAKMGCGSPMKMDEMAMDIDRRKPKRKRKRKHKKHSGGRGNGVIGGGCRNTPKRGKKRY